MCFKNAVFQIIISLMFLFYFVLYSVVVDGASYCPNFDFRIRRIDLKNGFHRDLTTAIEWSGMTGCNIMIEETLPRGMFVDVDQLRTTANLSDSKVLSKGRVNVECPAHLAEPQHILIYQSHLPSQSRENHFHLSVKVPVHLRYHLPVPGKAFESISLSPPNILIHCSDKRLSERCEDRIVKYPCDETDQEVCEWIHITKEIQLNEHLEFKVPIGVMSYRSIVTIATALSTIGGTAWTISVMLKSPS